MKRIKRQPSNARVVSLKYITELKPVCHKEATWRIVHETLEGRYEVRCAECGADHLRIEVGRSR